MNGANGANGANFFWGEFFFGWEILAFGMGEERGKECWVLHVKWGVGEMGLRLMIMGLLP